MALARYTAGVRRRLRAERARADTAERRVRLLVEAIEDERLHVAQAIHDGPVQDLLALALETRLAERHSEPADESLSIGAVVRDLRALSEGLRPPALGPFGLAAALRAHADRFQRRHPGIVVDLALDPADALPPRTRLALFRIAQEALDNAALHGPPLHVHVELRVGDGRAALTVRDDGAGFQVPGDSAAFAEAGRYGVLGMTGQAEAVGARLHLESRPGRTAVRVEVPLPPPRGRP